MGQSFCQRFSIADAALKCAKPQKPPDLLGFLSMLQGLYYVARPLLML